jgi:hypothetical protein
MLICSYLQVIYWLMMIYTACKTDKMLLKGIRLHTLQLGRMFMYALIKAFNRIDNAMFLAIMRSNL